MNRLDVMFYNKYYSHSSSVYVNQPSLTRVYNDRVRARREAGQKGVCGGKPPVPANMRPACVRVCTYIIPVEKSYNL